MKILIFTNETTANDKMDELIANADLPQEVSKTITTLYKHTTQDKWWFFRADCENMDFANGGVAANTTLMNGWVSSEICTEEDKTMQELIDEGYLPEPPE